ncbi:MAG: hypothetical protein E7335_07105 [Clostridiales bacterium]|nr:hypothetical protein [Clostridiales bacterium]
MKRTRIMAWMLAMVLLLGCMSIPAGADEERNLLSIVAVEGDTIWVHTTEGLAPFDEEGQQTGEALYPGADCYAIGPDGHMYYAVGGDVFEFDREGNEIDKWETEADRFSKMLANEKYIVLMSDGQYTVINADAHTVASGVSEELFDICLCDAESFMIAEDGMLARYARVDFETLEVIEARFNVAFEGMAFSSPDEGFYLYDGGDVYHMDFADGEEQIYRCLLDVQHVWDLRLIGENIYAIADDGLRVYPRENEMEATKVLKIHGADFYNNRKLKKAIAIFTQLYPEYRVELTGDVVKKSVHDELMTTTAKYDILLLAPDDTNYRLSGLMMDLSDCEQLMENLNGYIDMPFLWESDGSLYGIPMRVDPCGFGVKANLWRRMKDTFPDEWTMEDLYSYVDLANERGVKLVSTDYRWSALRQQYETGFCDLMGGVMEYENDTFRSLVSLWKQLDAEGLIEYSVVGTGNALFSYGSMSITQTMNKWNHVSIGMPLLNGEEVTPIELYGFYVYKYSENTDAAVKFLEIYTSPEVQIMAEGPEGAFLKGVKMEEYPNSTYWTLGIDCMPTEEEVEKWEHFLRTGRLVERIPAYEEEVKDAVISLLTDAMTADEFVTWVQAQADGLLEK